VRIGTWNLEGRWSADHADALAGADCDVWLLTEAPPRATLDGYEQHLSAALTPGSLHWSGLLSRLPIERLPDPHPTAVVARVDGVLMCASVLPWPFAEPGLPWEGESHLEQLETTVAAVQAVLKSEDVVWGGGWNQPLHGNIVGFSPTVQAAILTAVDALELQVPTASLTARHGRGQSSIDHVAVPASWVVAEVGKVDLPDGLSDHDAYWVDAAPADEED